MRCNWPKLKKLWRRPKSDCKEPVMRRQLQLQQLIHSSSLRNVQLLTCRSKFNSLLMQWLGYQHASMVTMPQATAHPVKDKGLQSAGAVERQDTSIGIVPRINHLNQKMPSQNQLRASQPILLSQ